MATDGDPGAATDGDPEAAHTVVKRPFPSLLNTVYSPIHDPASNLQ